MAERKKAFPPPTNMPLLLLITLFPSPPLFHQATLKPMFRLPAPEGCQCHSEPTCQLPFRPYQTKQAFSVNDRQRRRTTSDSPILRGRAFRFLTSCRDYATPSASYNDARNGSLCSKRIFAPPARFHNTALVDANARQSDATMQGLNLFKEIHHARGLPTFHMPVVKTLTSVAGRSVKQENCVVIHWL